jgi:AraC-like DNA-binding protein
MSEAKTLILLALPAPTFREVQSASQAFLDRVAAAIDEGMADEAFDVEGLAARVGVGRSHLYRRLSALTGCSPAKLILERRLEHAAHLLAREAGNVSEVADAVGFKSVSHFTERFRQRFGATPSAFRVAARGRDAGH